VRTILLILLILISLSGQSTSAKPLALVIVTKVEHHKQYGYSQEGCDELYWTDKKIKGLPDRRPEKEQHPIWVKVRPVLQVLLPLAAAVVISLL
jgi:hypothetical protein